MPEGPSIIILKEQLQPFVGKRVLSADGYAKGFDASVLLHQTITGLKSWGKQLLICFPEFAVRVHMGLFGSYKINGRGKRNASLHMQFNDGEVNFYISNVKLIQQPLNELYDWAADVMNPKFDAKKAREKLMRKPERMICDALLDQDIFAGSGNIVKNEVLFISRVHPESKTGTIPPRKLSQLIKDTVKFCDDFYQWKKNNVLLKHLQVYEKESCPRDHIPLHKADLGKNKRRTYFCPKCQLLYQ